MAAPRAKITTDKVFDGLAEKFRRNVYGTAKGWLRQQILYQDPAADSLSQSAKLSLIAQRMC